jgi:hypothetical protein
MVAFLFRRAAAATSSTASCPAAIVPQNSMDALDALQITVKSVTSWVGYMQVTFLVVAEFDDSSVKHQDFSGVVAHAIVATTAPLKILDLAWAKVEKDVDAWSRSHSTILEVQKLVGTKYIRTHGSKVV